MEVKTSMVRLTSCRTNDNSDDENLETDTNVVQESEAFGSGVDTIPVSKDFIAESTQERTLEVIPFNCIKYLRFDEFRGMTITLQGNNEVLFYSGVTGEQFVRLTVGYEHWLDSNRS